MIPLAAILWMLSHQGDNATGMSPQAISTYDVCSLDGKLVSCPIKPPEPIDVPAVEEDYETGNPEARFGKRWTCADKSRILLRSEDDKHWCHKPQP